mmetsp:Transcript_91994/g.281516  ORF Transcript_91994/g.281516 Transcript_91994/m.281516 type:complete len:284 (-) Transcript_91994:212-1063(-)
MEARVHCPKLSSKSALAVLETGMRCEPRDPCEAMEPRAPMTRMSSDARDDARETGGSCALIVTLPFCDLRDAGEALEPWGCIAHSSFSSLPLSDCEELRDMCERTEGSLNWWSACVLRELRGVGKLRWVATGSLVACAIGESEQRTLCTATESRALHKRPFATSGFAPNEPREVKDVADVREPRVLTDSTSVLDLRADNSQASSFGAHKQTPGSISKLRCRPLCKWPMSSERLDRPSEPGSCPGAGVNSCVSSVRRSSNDRRCPPTLPVMRTSSGHVGKAGRG